MGMRWAHILGDAFSASECINMWGKMMANQTLPPQFVKTPPINHQSLHDSSSCRSLKLLESLGDNWLTPNNSKMQMHTFHLTEKKLSNLLSGEKKNKYKVEPFEVISAIVWKSMAKVRGTKIVTVFKKRSFYHNSTLENELPCNGHQVIGIVEAQTMSLITDADPLEIAKLIAERFMDETSVIEKRMEEGNGSLDFVVYGSNLTFVDLEEVNLYGLQLKGQGPIFANLSVGGVGDEGTVVVVPDSSGGGRAVNVILPEDQLQHLKNELRVEWGIF